ncbi:MAG: YafY family transcriptional regulator [Chitinophagaceae bacterium]|nr:YafY family transcriptional regulator [Chitinophagaceae bacterium]
MNRVDRLLGIITTLQSKKFVTAEKLADKYNISIRTVYRDIKAIAEQGIPVSFEQNRGYFLVDGYFLPPVSFTSEEANALLLMQTVVERFADKSILTHYTAALDKVKAVMRPAQREKLERLQQQMKFQTSHPGYTDFEYLSVLQTAISSKTKLILDYKNNNNEVSKREVEPIGLIFYAYNWHLAAWCHNRNDYRDFRVSRILKVKDTGWAFSKADHIDINDYMKLLPVNY